MLQVQRNAKEDIKRKYISCLQQIKENDQTMGKLKGCFNTSQNSLLKNKNIQWMTKFILRLKEKDFEINY